MDINELSSFLLMEYPSIIVDGRMHRITKKRNCLYEYDLSVTLIYNRMDLRDDREKQWYLNMMIIYKDFQKIIQRKPVF